MLSNILLQFIYLTLQQLINTYIDKNKYFVGQYKKKVVKEMTEGGVDYSFECVGLASLLNEAFISTRTVRL